MDTESPGQSDLRDRPITRGPNGHAMINSVTGSLDVDIGQANHLRFGAPARFASARMPAITREETTTHAITPTNRCGVSLAVSLASVFLLTSTSARTIPTQPRTTPVAASPLPCGGAVA